MHLISLKDTAPADLNELIDLSIALKKSPEKYADAMSGRTLALLFQKTSTRTRCAGEIGITQMGGHSFFLDWRATNFGLADIGDEIKVLSSYVDLVLARFLKNSELVRMAESSTVPVLNGCCNRYHPTQAVADLMTIKEKFGKIEGVKLAYVGAHNNVCNSLIIAGLKTGMKVTVVSPEENHETIDSELFQEARQAGTYETSSRLRETLCESDAVYTDTWIDMEFFSDPKFEQEKNRRIQRFMPYQLNAELLKGLELQILHCMPVHRNYELSDELVNDGRSSIFTQAENRLHSMKAIMLKLLLNGGTTKKA